MMSNPTAYAAPPVTLTIADAVQIYWLFTQRSRGNGPPLCSALEKHGRLGFYTALASLSAGTFVHVPDGRKCISLYSMLTSTARSQGFAKRLSQREMAFRRAVLLSAELTAPLRYDFGNGKFLPKAASAATEAGGAVEPGGGSGGEGDDEAEPCADVAGAMDCGGEVATLCADGAHSDCGAIATESVSHGAEDSPAAMSVVEPASRGSLGAWLGNLWRRLSHSAPAAAEEREGGLVAGVAAEESQADFAEVTEQELPAGPLETLAARQDTRGESHGALWPVSQERVQPQRPQQQGGGGSSTAVPHRPTGAANKCPQSEHKNAPECRPEPKKPSTIEPKHTLEGVHQRFEPIGHVIEYCERDGYTYYMHVEGVEVRDVSDAAGRRISSEYRALPETQQQQRVSTPATTFIHVTKPIACVLTSEVSRNGRTESRPRLVWFPPEAGCERSDLFEQVHFGRWQYWNAAPRRNGLSSALAQRGLGIHGGTLCWHCGAALGFGYAAATQECSRCRGTMMEARSGEFRNRVAFGDAKLSLSELRQTAEQRRASCPDSDGPDTDATSDEDYCDVGDVERGGAVTVGTRGTSTRCGGRTRGNSQGSTNRPPIKHFAMGPDPKKTEAAVAQALASGAYKVFWSSTGQPLLYATYEAIEPAVHRALGTPERLGASMGVTEILCKISDVAEWALNRPGEPHDGHLHHNVFMYMEGFFCKPGGGREKYVVRKTTDEPDSNEAVGLESCRVMISPASCAAAADALPADGHAAEAAGFAYPVVPQPWPHKNTEQCRAAILEGCAKLHELADTIIAASTRTALYLQHHGDVDDKFALRLPGMKNCALPGVHASAAQYITGAPKPARLDAFTHETAAAELDECYACLKAFRGAAIELLDRDFPGWNQRRATGVADAGVSAAGGVAAGGPFAGRVKAVASPTPAGATKGKGKKRTLAPAPVQEETRLGVHLDGGDLSGNSPLHRPQCMQVTGTTSIFGRNEEACEDGTGTLFLLEGTDGSYPGNAEDAQEAIFRALLPEGDPDRKGCRAVVINGYAGGGSYTCCYLGLGGLWHCGIRMTSQSMRCILYVGEPVVVASGIELAAAEQGDGSPVWSEVEVDKHRGHDLAKDSETLADAGVTADSIITVIVPKAAGGEAREAHELLETETLEYHDRLRRAKQPPDTDELRAKDAEQSRLHNVYENGLKLMSLGHADTRVRLRFAVSDEVRRTKGLDSREFTLETSVVDACATVCGLRRAVARHLRVEPSDVFLVRDQRLVDTVSYGVRQEQSKLQTLPTLEGDDLAAAQTAWACAAMQARVYQCLLRCARWRGDAAGTDAFAELNTLQFGQNWAYLGPGDARGTYSSSGTPFNERRFTQNEPTAIAALAAIAHEGGNNVNVMFYRFVHVCCRLNSVALGIWHNEVAAAPSLLLCPERTRLVMGKVATARKAVPRVDAPDSNTFRGLRFGNNIQREDQCPPSEKLPQLWPNIRAWLASLFEVGTAEQAAGGSASVGVQRCSVDTVLGMSQREWIKHHVAPKHGVHLVGAIWALVTARERWFYIALLDEACPSHRVPWPSTVDEFQDVDAGAMTGLVWSIGKDDARYALSQETARALFDHLADGNRAKNAYDAAMVWLEQTILPQLTPESRVAAQEAIDSHRPLFTELAQPPTYLEQENIACDGMKALMGLHGRVQRNRFRPKDNLFTLKRPGRVLLLRREDGQIRAYWHHVGGASDREGDGDAVADGDGPAGGAASPPPFSPGGHAGSSSLMVAGLTQGLGSATLALGQAQTGRASRAATRLAALPLATATAASEPAGGAPLAEQAEALISHVLAHRLREDALRDACLLLARILLIVGVATRVGWLKRCAFGAAPHVFTIAAVLTGALLALRGVSRVASARREGALALLAEAAQPSAEALAALALALGLLGCRHGARTCKLAACLMAAYADSQRAGAAALIRGELATLLMARLTLALLHRLAEAVACRMARPSRLIG